MGKIPKSVINHFIKSVANNIEEKFKFGVIEKTECYVCGNTRYCMFDGNREFVCMKCKQFRIEQQKNELQLFKLKLGKLFSKKLGGKMI